MHHAAHACVSLTRRSCSVSNRRCLRSWGKTLRQTEKLPRKARPRLKLRRSARCFERHFNLWCRRASNLYQSCIKPANGKEQFVVPVALSQIWDKGVAADAKLETYTHEPDAVLEDVVLHFTCSMPFTHRSGFVSNRRCLRSWGKTLRQTEKLPRKTCPRLKLRRSARCFERHFNLRCRHASNLYHSCIKPANGKEQFVVPVALIQIWNNGLTADAKLETCKFWAFT